MADLLATLRGNPFNSPTGQKIEQATDASLQAENWALNMEICDLINETDEGPKDAVKAIRKRLLQNMGKNHTVVLYTLTVLETCVKNCGRRFHLLVMQKDFIMDLVKLIGPKNDPPASIQEKVLGLIQSWADAFHGNPEMQGVVQAYQELKQKGIDFPMTDLDAMAPIITPQRTVPPSASLASHVPEASANSPQPVDPQVAQTGTVPETHSSAIILAQEQVAKLRSELDVVQENMKVFSEMLTELSPGHEHPEDLQLLLDLYRTLYAMQNRIVELIDKIGVEEMTSELLRINDELNNLFLRYERYEKKRAVIQAPQDVKPTVQKSENLIDKPLIDFGETSESTDDVTPRVADLKITSSKMTTEVKEAAVKSPEAELVDEFDMFAQSRNTSYEANKTKSSTYADNMNLDHIKGGLGSFAQHKGQVDLEEDDVKHLSQWLNDEPTSEQNPDKSASNVDFEKFLAERATAAERLPTVPQRSNPASVRAAPLHPGATSINSSNKADKEDAENSLFAL